MQVFTLGMPAIGPFSTLSWQSVQTAFFAMCVLWGNGMGCVATGRLLKKWRAASPAVRCASVKTLESDAGPGPHAAAHDNANAATAPASAGLNSCTRRTAARSGAGRGAREPAIPLLALQASQV